MNALTVERIKEVFDTNNQDEQGQFVQGSKTQQHAAQFAEEFLLTYDIIEPRIEDPQYAEFCTYAVTALADIQVRDYVIGIINDNNINTINRALTNLSKITPQEYVSPINTMLALTYYELDDADKAIEIIDTVPIAYSMATLLKRVFSAGWDKSEFKEMRQELHPKVVAGIFGDKE